MALLKELSELRRVSLRRAVVVVVRLRRLDPFGKRRGHRCVTIQKRRRLRGCRLETVGREGDFACRRLGPEESGNGPLVLEG